MHAGESYCTTDHETFCHVRLFSASKACTPLLLELSDQTASETRLQGTVDRRRACQRQRASCPTRLSSKQLGCICISQTSAVQLPIFGSQTAVTNMTSLKLAHCRLLFYAPSCGLSSLSGVLKPYREEVCLPGVSEGYINVIIPLQHGTQRSLVTDCSHTTGS